MPIVQSFGALEASAGVPAWAPGPGGSVTLHGYRQSYAEIYASQPNIRTCVDFLARNIAELGVHAFRRVSDTDRERLHGHDLVDWLENPNPGTTRYRLFESLMGDLGIYFNAFWLKVPDRRDGRRRVGLLRLPPEEVTVEGGLLPALFVWTRNGQRRDTPDQVVFFNGYNPLNALMGLSPLDTLRRILAEEAAAGAHRESYWRNASRVDGVIERPLAAPKWSPDQKASWREQWRSRFSGAAGAGEVAVLEDGMVFKPASWSARDSEYVGARKLGREECAAAYHIPLPMVGILEHATFSNVREQHKHLYQDCLGPWLRMIKEEVQRQLLRDCDDVANVCIEFNIAEKLKGSFEEQSGALHTAVGKPWMRVNEARARQNLPADDDPASDQIAAQQGGPAAAPVPGRLALPPGPEDEEEATAAAVEPVLHACRLRQQSKLARLPVSARPDAFAIDMRRWNRELEADLVRIVGDPAEARRLAFDANDATLTRLLDAALEANP